LVTAATPLPVGLNWYLHVLTGTPNHSNTASTTIGKNIFVGNIAPFEVQSISPRITVNNPRQIVVKFNSPLSEELTQKELMSMVKTTPVVKNAKYQALGKSIIISGQLREQDTWKVNVTSEASSNSGLTLAKSVNNEITFESIPTEIALPAYDSAQYANGNRQYAIDTTNMASIRIRVKQLTPENAIRTMQGYRHYVGNGHNGQKIDPKSPLPYSLINGETIYDRTVFLDNKIDTSREFTFNWNEILPKEQHTANLFISVEGVAKEKTKGDNRIAQSFIQLTDIGLCWKLSENEAMIYAFSCLTGKPLNNLELQVYNEDAQQASTAKTDSNGIARIARNKAARHLRAIRGNDSYIIPFDNTLDTVALWRFPVDIEWHHIKGWKRTAKMFTDRNLYRPGETVQLKGIARRFLDNQIKLPSEKKAQLIISDSASRVLTDQEITLSANGTFDHSLQLPAETVGRFTAKLIFPEDPNQKTEYQWIANQYRIFYHSFNVQEFRRNTYEVTSDIPNAAPGAKDIVLNINAQYYQGQPVKHGAVQWYFDATQTGFYPDKYRDYLFGDHRTYDSWYWSHYFGYNDDDNNYRGSSNRNGKIELDNSGKTSISFGLPKLTFPTATVVRLRSEVTDTRDQTLSSIAKTNPRG